MLNETAHKSRWVFPGWAQGTILPGHVPQGGSPDTGRALMTGYSLLALEVSGQFGAVPEAA